MWLLICAWHVRQMRSLQNAKISKGTVRIASMANWYQCRPSTTLPFCKLSANLNKPQTKQWNHRQLVAQIFCTTSAICSKTKKFYEFLKKTASAKTLPQPSATFRNTWQNHYIFCSFRKSFRKPSASFRNTWQFTCMLRTLKNINFHFYLN